MSNTTNQVALNKSLLGQKEEYTEEWLEQANAAALADYQIAVDNAEQKYADILGIEARRIFTAYRKMLSRLSRRIEIKMLKGLNRRRGSNAITTGSKN